MTNKTHIGSSKKVRARLLRWSGKILLWSLLAILGVGFLVHVPLVRHGIVHRVIRSSIPYPGLNVTVSETSGSFLTGVRLYGIEITGEDGQSLFEVDTLSLSFRPFELLWSNQIRSIDLRGGRINLAQRDTGAWNLPVSTKTENQEELNSSRLAIGSVTIRELSGKFKFWPPEADSVLVLDRLGVELKQLQGFTPLSVVIDTIDASFTPPGAGYSVRLGLGAVVTNHRVESFRLALQSELSHVIASGSMTLPEHRDEVRDDELRDIEIIIDAPSIALSDIAPFIPSLRPEGLARLTGSVSGSSDHLEFEASAILPGDGTVRARGSFHHQADSLRLVLDASGSGIDPSAIFVGPRIPHGHISASATVDLAGSQLSSIGGDVLFELRDGVIGGRRLDYLRIEQTFTLGKGGFELAAESKDGRITAVGWTRPWDDSPSWDFTGSVGDLDAAGLGFIEHWKTRLSGRFGSTRVASSDGQTITTAYLNLQNSMIGDCLTPLVRLDATARDSTWSVEGRADLCMGASISVRGRMTKDNRWTAAASLTGVDVARLAGDSLRSSISGSALFSGTVGNEATELSSGHGRFSQIKYGDFSVDSLDVSLSGALDDVDAHFTAWSGSGKIGADIKYEVNDGVLIDRVNFESIDPADWTRYSGPSLTVSGQGFARITPGSSVGIVSSGVIDLLPSTINDAELSSGHISWSASPDSVVFDSRIVFENEKSVVHLSGDIHRKGTEWSTGDLGGSFINLNLGPLLGRRRMITNLTGRMLAQGDPKSGHLTIGVDDGSTINRLRLDTLEVQTDWEGAAYAGSVRARAGAGSMDILVEAVNGDSFSVDASVHAEGLDVAAAVGLDTLGSAIWFDGALSGRGEDLAGTRWTTTVERLDGRWGSLGVTESVAAAHFDSSAIRIDSLRIKGNFGEITASGYAPLDPSIPDPGEMVFSFQSRGSNNLGPFERLFPVTWATMKVDGRLFGRFNRRRIEIRADAEALRAGDHRASLMTAEFRGEVDAENVLSAAELETELRILSLAGVRSESFRLDLVYDGKDIVASPVFVVDERRSVQGEITVDPRRAPYDVMLNEFSADLDGDAWKLLAPARIVFRDIPQVTGLVLTSGDRKIAVNSATSVDDIVSTFVSISDFRIDSVSDIFGLDGLGGSLSGLLSTFSDGGEFTADGSITADVTSFGNAAGLIETGISYRNGAILLNARMQHSDGKTAQISGVLPFPPDRATPENQTVRFSIEADEFPINWIRPFFDPSLVDHISGTVSSDLLISGTWNAPKLTGTTSISGGVIGLPELGGPRGGLRFTDISASLQLSDDSVFVEKLEVRSGGGVLRGSGTMAVEALSLGAYSIDLTADDFLAIDNTQYRAVLDGNIQLTGTTRAPRIDGDVVITSADFHLTKNTSADAFDPVTLTDEDIRTLERRFGINISETDTTTFDLYRSLTIGDMTARLERDIWLRSRSNPRMDIQFTGDLDITKRPGQDAEIFGSINVLPERSRIVQFGRRFDLTRGALSFNGPASKPVMDMEAEYTVKSRASQDPEVTIQLLARGDVEQLDVFFNSDPAMELADIVSYIATGRPASESLQISSGQDQGYMKSAASLAVGPVANLIENLAASGLGLDVIEIDHNGLQGVTLTAGKYVSPRFYVAVSQPISFTGNADKTGSGNENHTQVAMEYELVRQLLLNLMNRGSILRINLRWEYAF